MFSLFYILFCFMFDLILLCLFEMMQNVNQAIRQELASAKSEILQEVKTVIQEFRSQIVQDILRSIPQGNLMSFDVGSSTPLSNGQTRTNGATTTEQISKST